MCKCVGVCVCVPFLLFLRQDFHWPTSHQIGLCGRQTSPMDLSLPPTVLGLLAKHTQLLHLDSRALMLLRQTPYLLGHLPNPYLAFLILLLC